MKRKPDVLHAVENTYMRYQILLRNLEGADPEIVSREVDKFFISSMRSIIGTYFLSKHHKES